MKIKTPLNNLSFAHPGRSIDEFFNHRYRKMLGMRDDFSPAVNTSYDEDSYEIEIAVPGIDKDDLKLKLRDNLLIISCEMEELGDETKRGYFMREFGSFSFERCLALPPDVDEDHIKAQYRKGVLYIQLPKLKTSHKDEGSKSIAIS